MSLERIERHDGPLNSVVWIREAAVEEAQVLDERIAGGEVAGPLCGLPLLVKDNENLAGATTTFGSRLKADDPPRVRVRELYGQRRLRHDQEPVGSRLVTRWVQRRLRGCTHRRPGCLGHRDRRRGFD